MRWTSVVMVGSLCVGTMAGCKANRGDNYNSGAVANDTISTQSGAAGTAADTSMQRSDTGSMHSDSAKSWTKHDSTKAAQ